MSVLTAGNEDEGCASVDDTGRGVEDGIATVADRLVNAPVLARRGGGREGPASSGSAIVPSGIAVKRKRTRRRCRQCTLRYQCRRT